MTHIIPEYNFSDSISEPIQSRLNFEYKVVSCAHCGFPMKVPLIVTAEDIRKINQFIDILNNYLKNHPEVAEEMIKELITEIEGGDNDKAE